MGTITLIRPVVMQTRLSPGTAIASSSGSTAAGQSVTTVRLAGSRNLGQNTVRMYVTDTVTAVMQDLAITITRNDTAATITAMTTADTLEAARSTALTVTFGKEVDTTTVTSSTTSVCMGSIRVSLDNFTTYVA